MLQRRERAKGLLAGAGPMCDVVSILPHRFLDIRVTCSRKATDPPELLPADRYLSLSLSTFPSLEAFHVRGDIELNKKRRIHSRRTLAATPYQAGPIVFDAIACGGKYPHLSNTSITPNTQRNILELSELTTSSGYMDHIDGAARHGRPQ